MNTALGYVDIVHSILCRCQLPILRVRPRLGWFCGNLPAPALLGGREGGGGLGRGGLPEVRSLIIGVTPPTGAVAERCCSTVGSLGPSSSSE
eukprot:scaffold52027_cov27-Prasinocladus_malaysianus.AAC.2